MRILVTVERFPPEVFGGGENSSYLFSKMLAKKHEVHVITSKTSSSSDTKVSPVEKVVTDNKIFLTDEKSDGIYIHRIIKLKKGILPVYIRDHEIFYTKSFRTINSLLKTSGKFDLIHSLSMNMVVGSVLAAKKHKLPVVATVNDHWATCFLRRHFRNGEECIICSSKGLKECLKSSTGRTISLSYVKQSMRIRKHFLSRCNGLITISDRVKEILQSNGFKIPIETIPILVDTELFNYEKPRYTKKVLNIGRIDSGKGVDIAIKAIAKAGIGTLVVAGDGPELEQCKNLANDLGIKDRVEFLGNVDYENIPKLIHDSDIIIAPFQRVEAFGRVLLEANACGRGVITSDIGGGSQMFIKNGKNGLSFPPNDIAGMGKAIKGILSNKKLIESLGRTGRNMVENQMKTEKILTQTEKFYNLIIKKFA